MCAGPKRQFSSVFAKIAAWQVGFRFAVRFASIVPLNCLLHSEPQCRGHSVPTGMEAVF